ncbi:MAG: hypothetical protein AAFX09_01310 [Pseudomonadota bacterium]
MIQQLKTSLITLLAVSAMAFGLGSASAQHIGGDLELNLDQNDDARFLAADATVRGRIGGDLDGMAADVSIDADVGGDVSILGADIDLSGTVGGDVSLAGADILIHSANARDLDVAGADITLEGSVMRSASMAGALVTVSNSASIGGKAEIAAREIVMDGVIGGDAELRAREIRISGQIAGSTEIRAERVVISATAVMGGPVLVRGPNEPVVEPGAELPGGVTYEFAQYDSDDFGEFEGVDLDFNIGPPGWALGGAFAISAFVLGALATLIAPRSVAGIASSFRRRPFVSGLLGLIVFAFAPVMVVVLFVLLAITVIGIPLGFILLLAYPVILFLAFAFGGLAFGDLIFNRSGNGIGVGLRILSLFLLLAVLGALGVVPVIGWLLSMVVLCVGLGAWTLAIFARSDNGAGSQLLQAEEGAV